MQVCKSWSEVGGVPALWAHFPLHLHGSKLTTFSSINRLTMVTMVRVTWPSEILNLSSFRVIFDHFTQLQELNMEFPGYGLSNMIGAHSTDFLTVGKMLATRGVACCMSDTDSKVYICPKGFLTFF